MAMWAAAVVLVLLGRRVDQKAAVSIAFHASVMLFLLPNLNGGIDLLPVWDAEIAMFLVPIGWIALAVALGMLLLAQGSRASR